ncbi:MAG: DUF4230 domain-containing protein [Candidatus Krumholzibacteriota bacterium]|nr:DUF4230 domain-containing protein [Candidatus Krumholzibacteriota bacterium]
MTTVLVSGVFGFSLAVAIWIAFRILKKRLGHSGPSVKVFASIDHLRSVGELVVFKIITKEIVTTAEHWFGEAGKKYFQWLISAKKMAMVFEFEIDFRYDLRDPEFVIEEKKTGHYLLKMPKCLYEVHIRDISFYDEQSAKLLPWLLPGLLTKAFGTGSTEEDKNRLKEEAKLQAAQMAGLLVQKMRSEVQNSTRKTLEALARNFGAEEVTFDFTHADLIRSKVEAALLNSGEG